MNYTIREIINNLNKIELYVRGLIAKWFLEVLKKNKITFVVVSFHFLYLNDCIALSVSNPIPIEYKTFTKDAFKWSLYKLKKII